MCFKQVLTLQNVQCGVEDKSLLVHESCQERKCAGEDNDDTVVDKSESCGKPNIPMMMMIPVGAGFVE
jgi:hypothetical protein